MTLQDLPPSAKLAYRVLEDEGPLTQAALLEETGLPRSTLTDALAELREAGLITEETSPRDARNRLYSVDSDGSDDYVR